MLLLAWILAIAGAVVAFVVSLAGAMSSVPQLHWQDAIVAIPLPVLAGSLAAWRLARPGTPKPAARSGVAAVLPLGLAVLTLLFMAMTYFEQPGGPM
ncbi:MAG TPA: hypothetical protein VLD58_08830 [Gemmatimonadales bacterium]|jgi:hypothetical protein|nr:hypothetical protein [Gemmatimonadales bacterium]